MTTIAPYEFVVDNITKSDNFKFVKTKEGNAGIISCVVNVDGDNWEAFAPGYENELNSKKKYKIKKIIGVFEHDTGKHKIAVRLYAPGFDELLANKHVDAMKKKKKKLEKGVWKTL